MITKPDIEKIIRLLYKQGLTNVSITGGEPLLYPHLGYLFSLLNKLNIESSINTNGTVLDPDLLKHIVTCGLSGIDVSLTDIMDDTRFYVQPVNYAAKKIDTLSKIVKQFGKRIKVTASTILTASTISNLDAIEAKLHEVGVRAWRLREYMSPTESGNDFSSFIFDTNPSLLHYLIEFARKKHKLRVWGYLFDFITYRQISMRCKDFLSFYLFIDESKKYLGFLGLLCQICN